MENNGREDIKMSYEDLERSYNGLIEQYKALYEKLQTVNLSNAFKRLDYLFKITDNPTVFGSDIVDKSIAEIDSLLFIKSEVSE